METIFSPLFWLSVHGLPRSALSARLNVSTTLVVGKTSPAALGDGETLDDAELDGETLGLTLLDGDSDGDSEEDGDTDADGLTEALGLTEADGDTDADGDADADAELAASYNATSVEIVEFVPSVNADGPAQDSLVVVRMRVWTYHDTAAALLRERLSNCST